jgi:hypothetical protein
MAASVVIAVAGSILLVARNSRKSETTTGLTASVPLPGHPGPVAAGAGKVWVALNGDPNRPAVDQPLLLVDPVTDAVAQIVYLPGGGEASSLARVGDRLIASVRPVGGREFGPRRLVALDWRHGTAFALGASHVNDDVMRDFDGPVDHIVQAGNALWALESRPGRLWRLDLSTLAPAYPAIGLSHGLALGLAVGDGYLWATSADAGEVFRIDPATRSKTRIHVGGFPVGIVVANRSVWFADRSSGTVVRLDTGTGKRIGDPIGVGAKPTWLAVVGNLLFVTDADSGTITRIDTHAGRKVGLPIRIAPRINGGVAPALATTGQAIWASNFAARTVIRINSIPVAAPSIELTLTGTGDGPVANVSDGSMASKGTFTVSGPISDEGTYTEYRTATDKIAKIRSVNVGKKGTIVFVITIDLTNGRSTWTITSGTGRYAGRHGTGTLPVDNFERNPYTFVMKGTISR